MREIKRRNFGNQTYSKGEIWEIKNSFDKSNGEILEIKTPFEKSNKEILEIKQTRQESKHIIIFVILLEHHIPGH